MDYPEDSTEAAELLKKAIPLMVERQIPANPINYSIWYSFVANRNPELNKALKPLLEGNNYDSEQAQEIFLKHVISEHLEDQQHTLDKLTQLAGQLIQHLNVSTADSSNFDQDLQSNLKTLNECEGDSVSDVLEAIVSSTQSISDSNKAFQQQLGTASQEVAKLKQELELAQKQAYFDTLTQLYNRHAFDEQLDQLLLNEANANNVCLILCDLDHFKSFNDNYGHVIGDRVLQKVGEILLDHLPANCTGARYGGEEFAIIANNADPEQAAEVAETVRQKLSLLRIRLKNADKVIDNISASFGVARFEPSESKTQFIERADKALYRAKEAGRNQVQIYDETVDII